MTSERRCTELPSANGCQWKTHLSSTEISRCIHKQPFRIGHGLHEHPLFSIDSLLGLACEVQRRSEDIHIDAGDISLADRWGIIPRSSIPLPEAIERAETEHIWLIIKRVERVARYNKVLKEFEAFIRGLLGPKQSSVMRRSRMSIIVASPHRLTPLHFDAEINFLLQVMGQKDVWICDPMDRTVVTEQDLERYYALGEFSHYRQEAEERATCFTLVPGDGVHIPTHSAHWVRNGPDISVSVSINFDYPNRVYRNLYRANHQLRKLGLSPRPRGMLPLLDLAKALGVGTFDRTRSVVPRMLERVKGGKHFT